MSAPKKFPDTPEVLGYRQWMRGQGLSEATIASYGYWFNVMLRKYGNFELGYEAFLEAHRKPVVRAFLLNLAEYKKKKVVLKPIKVRHRRLPKYYDDLTESKLIEDQSMHKYKVLFWLLSECGLRISEAINLKYSDVKQYDTPPRLLITGKGDKEAFIYPSPDLIREIVAIPRREENSYVWSSPDSRRRGKPLTTNSARYHLKKAVPGLETRLHSFRHTFAKNHLKMGTNLPTIQQLLRHSDISTTSIYTQVEDKDMQGAAQKSWKKR